MTNNQHTFRKTLALVIIGIVFYTCISNPDTIEWFKAVISPVVSAFIMAYLLNPVVNFIRRKSKNKISHKLSVLLATLSVIAFIVIFVQMIIPSLSSSVSTLVKSFESVPNIETIFEGAANLINSFGIMEVSVSQISSMVDNGLSQIAQYMSTIATSLLNNLLSMTSTTLSFFVNFVIAIYMLLERDELIARIKRMTYAYSKKETADYLLTISKKAHTIFLDFFVGKIIDSTIVGIIVFVILLIFNYKLALIIALIVGITNIIPYFGPYIGAVPAVLISLFTDGGSMALWLLLIIVVVQQFDGLYLGPKILGDKVGVSAFWVLVSVTVGGAVMGIWGMLLGVPVVVFCKNLLETNVAKNLADKNMETYLVEHLVSEQKGKAKKAKQDKKNESKKNKGKTVNQGK